MLKKRFFKTIDECEVAFEYASETASQVTLVCEINEWEPIPMKKNRKGVFRTRVRFPKEADFQFRYLIDGEIWENDCAADAYRLNEHGSDNSVVSTFSNN